MRRRIIDDVKIIEPPLNELTKKRSGFKHACSYGCLFLVLSIVGLTIFVRFFAGPGPQTLKKIPDNFPATIPIYDPDNIDNISFISGKYKSRSIEIAAVVPKIILSPLLLTLDQKDAAVTSSQGFTVRNLWKLVTTPITNSNNTIQIEWRNMDAEPNFIIAYYKTELKKNGFTIDIESTGKGVKQFSFSQGEIGGSLYVAGDEEERPGTDFTQLTINFPPTPDK